MMDRGGKLGAFDRIGGKVGCLEMRPKVRSDTSSVEYFAIIMASGTLDSGSCFRM